MASKYDPLSKHLESLDAFAWQTNFQEIERILGFSLPASARNHRSWWHNNTIGHPQAPAWMDIGWKTTDVDMGAETLVFRRVDVSARRTSTSDAERVPESVSQDSTAVSLPPRPRGLTDEGGIPFDLDRLMHGLSQARPIFHSEADFQHALAWHIHKVIPNSEVRLEYPFRYDDNTMYLDIWLPQERIAIELKYPTRILELNQDSEHFLLVNHQAQPPRRYDFLKDVQRLERVIVEGGASCGFAVLLTNDAYYWKSPIQSWRTAIDAALRLHEGRTVTGQLTWSERAGSGTTRGRHEAIDIIGTYDLHWRDYSTLGRRNNQQFRYLAVTVQ